MKWAPSFVIMSGILCAASQSAQISEVFADADQPQTSRIGMAIQILKRTPSGRKLVEKSLTAWKLSSAALGPNSAQTESDTELLQVIKAGAVSRTDAVLTRHYDPITGKESRDREVTIYINADQNLPNMVLDLAHEMVHASSRPSWDPYDPNLTSVQYIKQAIDGEGGEVQAVAMECRVALELHQNFQIPLKRCGAYLGGAHASEVQIEPIRRDFYRVGKWNKELASVLGPEVKSLPDLSGESPALYSSTGNAPYPVALLKEYKAITQIACENSKRRFQSKAHANPEANPELSTSVASVIDGRTGQDGPGRSLASVESANSGESNDSVATFLERRCK